MRMKFIICVCIIQIAVLVQAKDGFYSVIGPGTLRSNSDYHVTVSLHESPSPATIKVGINGTSYNNTKTIEIAPFTSKDVWFKIPKISEGDYNLTVEGIEGYRFHNTTKLNYANEERSVYIQTDKATYKPNDLVRFRVIVIDKNTKPAKISGTIDIVINDAARNRIKQWLAVTLVKGVYGGELQLSEFPALGAWSIDVDINGNSVSKSFDVDKYVLPKFEVKVNSAPDVAIADGTIKATAIAKYTYGQPVKGTAKFSIKALYYYYGGKEEPTVEKTVPIDGKANVEFDIAKELKVEKGQYSPPMQITVVVEESLTGLKQNGTATVNLHQDKYQISGVNTPYTYHPGKPVNITVVVKNLDGSPVQDTENKVNLTISPPDYWNPTPIPGPIPRPIPLAINNASTTATAITTTTTPPPPRPKTITLFANLNKNGMAEFEVVLSDQGNAYYSVRASYLDSSAYITSLSKFQPSETPADTSLKITIMTDKPRLYNEVSIKVSNGDPIPYFIYCIVGRGDILKSELVKLPPNSREYIFNFIPTFSMVPRATIFMHYVADGELKYTEESINFEKDFDNKISIDVPEEAKPGEHIQLKVSTSEDSYVGLLGVDQSVLLLKSGNDLQKDVIFQDLSRFDTRTPWSYGYGQYPGTQAGVVTMTNAHYLYFQNYYPIFAISSAFAGPGIPGPPAVIEAVAAPGSGAASSPSAPVVRKEFPESWIWDDDENTNSSIITLNETVPDTITSWIITGFSLSPEKGIALTEEASKLRVFQPFFISTNLPYSVKRGEVISIPVIIFNYMTKSLDVDVVLDNSDHEFDFTEVTNEVTESASEDVSRTKSITVPANDGKSVSFLIRPKVVGDISLKVTAKSTLAGDAIDQKLKVIPEGVTIYANKAYFVNLANTSQVTEEVNIAIPKDAVPDSQYVEISVVGDLLGPTIDKLDQLVRMPYGCGEQNMVNFVPNILVLKYLTAINQLKPEIEKKAKQYLEIGYQRELSYKHDDGSYSAFGKSDPSGSTWLTAYVVKSFHQAIPFTNIDPNVLKAGLQFLAGTQKPSGEFPEVGKVLDSSHSGGTLGLTAFVVLGFLENVESAAQYKTYIDKALHYLEQEIESSDDQYSMAITTLAMALAGRHTTADKLLAKLDGLSHRNADSQWWSVSIKPKNEWYGPRSVDVELTAYVVLAKLERGDASTVLPNIKWLVAQRNSNGGFTSTQDTVVGLQALIKFAEKAGSGSGTMTINFSDGQDVSGTINVNPTNALVLQTHVLPKTLTFLQIVAEGTGSALAQVSYRYNMANDDSNTEFTINSTVLQSTSERLRLSICVAYVDSNTESNMAVLEVSLPSGYTADTDSFDAIMQSSGAKRVETKNGETVVVIYFDSLNATHTCVEVNAIRTFSVAKQKPVPITVYDYYDNNKRATAYYQIESSLCDICQGSDCGNGCPAK